MLKVVFILACVAGALAGPLEERIVGGVAAANGQFPYQISMRRSNGQHYCGGSIINSRFILTAAHCVKDQSANDYFIVTGTNSLTEGGQAYAIEALAYHGGFNPQNLVNDIALIKVANDIQFSSLVQPAPLHQGEINAGDNLVLSGWGSTYTGSAPPNYLQYITLRAIDTVSCAQALSPGVINNDQICTFTRQGEGSCNGDSGGPLVYNGAVAGVVSWGRPCALGYPDVFTRVSHKLDWVQAAMQQM